MHNFKFYNPVRYIFGKGTISEIGKEIARAGVKKILLLAGGGSIKENGVYEQVTSSLAEHNIEYGEFWGVRVNPSLRHAEHALDKIRANGYEAILAVGGGSVIDEAKSIAAGVHSPSIWSNFESGKPITSAMPIFVVLTISATGSEMNSLAVLTNEEENKKWPIGGAALFPIATVVDPSVQASLPSNQTVNGGVDAISHILEFYFKGSNEEATLALNESLIKTIFKSLDILLVEPQNYDARASLAWAATLALNGISGIGLAGGEWAVHRIEHGISAIYQNVSHAEGLAVVFPAWIKYVHKLKPEIFERFARNIWNTKEVDDAVARMKAKLHSWGAPTSLRELGISEESIPEIADNVMMKGEFGTIEVLGRDDVIEILKLCAK